MYVEKSNNEKDQPEFAIKGLTLHQLEVINNSIEFDYKFNHDRFCETLSKAIENCINEEISKAAN